jgi:hypothetical protein
MLTLISDYRSLGITEFAHVVYGLRVFAHVYGLVHNLVAL